jgi:hypothetical protein
VQESGPNGHHGKRRRETDALCREPDGLDAVAEDCAIQTDEADLQPTSHGIIITREMQF